MSCQRTFVQAEKAKRKEELEKEKRGCAKPRQQLPRNKKQKPKAVVLPLPARRKVVLPLAPTRPRPRQKKVAAPPLANVDKDNADYYKNVQEDTATILRVFGQDFGSKPAVQIAPQSREGEGGIQEASFVSSFIFPLQRNK